MGQIVQRKILRQMFSCRGQQRYWTTTAAATTVATATVSTVRFVLFVFLRGRCSRDCLFCSPTFVVLCCFDGTVRQQLHFNVFIVVFLFENGFVGPHFVRLKDTGRRRRRRGCLLTKRSGRSGDRIGVGPNGVTCRWFRGWFCWL